MDKATKWLQFGGNTPGIVPSGTEGSTRDLRVYENVTAVVETGGKTGEVLVGTLVEVGDAWRVIGAPQLAADSDGKFAAGFFFQPAMGTRAKMPAGGPDETSQKLLADLETIDQAIKKAKTPEEKGKLNARRADLVEQVADAADTPDDRTMWLRQLADMISAAVQNGDYPDGAKRLGILSEKLAKTGKDNDLAAYVRFRQLVSEYGLSFQAPKPDYQKIQEKWIENLEQFVKDYPKAPDTAEAALQLAMTQEFAGEEDEAKKWYGQVVKSFPNAPQAKKAAGARARLESVGKRIAVRGKTITGDQADLAEYRGKVVLIQYWATWCEPAKADMAALKELSKKYRSNFRVLGVSLDGRRQDLTAYLKENPLPWPQIYEEGGLDSRPANDSGIMTVPTMILVDKDGKVVHRNVDVAELDRELKKLIR